MSGTNASVERGVRPAGGNGTVKGVTLIAIQVLPVMAVVSLFPAIPRLAARFGDVSDAALLIPMIITLPSLCIAIFSPGAGWLVDRIGRRWPLIVSLLLYCVSGLAPLVLDDLRVIIAARVVLGISEAGIVTIASTLIADYFGEDRYKWLAWQSALASVSGTVLIALGGVLADISWRGPFAIYVAAVPMAILAILYLDEPAARSPAGRGPVASGAFPWAAAAVIGSLTLVTSILYYVEPLHVATVLEQRGAGSATRVGLIQAATSIAYIAGAFLYRRLYALPIGALLGIAGGLIGIGMIGIGLSPTLAAVATWATVQQLGAGMIIPTLIAWAQARLPFDQRGRGMGIWATFFFLGLFLCPPIVTGTTGIVGDTGVAIAMLGAVTTLLAAALYLAGRRPAPSLSMDA